MSNIVLGIDPGTYTGMAIFHDGKLSKLRTTDLLGAIAFIKAEPTKLVAIEDSTLLSHIFTAPGLSKAASMKVARNIGEVDMACKIIKQICGEQGIAYYSISPKEKGAKLDAKRFNELTGWAARCNQHERDAAMVAWRFRSAH